MIDMIHGTQGTTMPGTVAPDGTEGEFGSFSGGTGPYGESMGRMGGGGWAVDPMAYSGRDPYGTWTTPLGADGEMNVEALPVERMDFGSERVWPNSLLPTVMDWDDRFMADRIRTDTH